MSVWWDEHAQKERSTLVYKIFYVWGWPVARWLMFSFMSSEGAHRFAIHWAIPVIGRIDRVWCLFVTIFTLPLLIVVWLLCLLPWFTCDPSEQAPDL
jgi:hypothetical protein